MLKKETLKLLKLQKEEKYTFEEIDKEELVLELLENIGVEDGEIRDGLIYSCLAHLLHDKHFEEDRLIEFLYALFDDKHLFYDLENKKKNSVLTRSFSSLQIVILLFVHKRDNLFSKEIILVLLDKFLEYFKKEQHLEGYNNEVGFLHSIAHSADVFDQFLTLEYFTEKEIKKIFESILDKMKRKDYYFSHDEDERMVVGMGKAIRRNILSKEYLFDWLSRLSTYEKTQQYPEMYTVTNNVKNMLRSLYFEFIYEDDFKYFTDEIKRVLKENVGLR